MADALITAGRRRTCRAARCGRRRRWAGRRGTPTPTTSATAQARRRCRTCKSLIDCEPLHQAHNCVSSWRVLIGPHNPAQDQCILRSSVFYSERGAASTHIPVPARGNTKRSMHFADAQGRTPTARMWRAVIARSWWRRWGTPSLAASTCCRNTGRRWTCGRVRNKTFYGKTQHYEYCVSKRACPACLSTRLQVCSRGS